VTARNGNVSDGAIWGTIDPGNENALVFRAVIEHGR
jgi:hypothetical protein